MSVEVCVEMCELKFVLEMCVLKFVLEIRVETEPEMRVLKLSKNLKNKIQKISGLFHGCEGLEPADLRDDS